MPNGRKRNRCGQARRHFAMAGSRSVWFPAVRFEAQLDHTAVKPRSGDAEKPRRWPCCPWRASDRSINSRSIRARNSSTTIRSSRRGCAAASKASSIRLGRSVGRISGAGTPAQTPREPRRPVRRDCRASGSRPAGPVPPASQLLPGSAVQFLDKGLGQQGMSARRSAKGGRTMVIVSSKTARSSRNSPADQFVERPSRSGQEPQRE